MYFPGKTRLRSWWNTYLFPGESRKHDDPDSEWRQHHHVTAWIALIAVSAVVLFTNLSYPLIEPDETRYAQIAIEMNRSGDWITPTLDGNPYLDKPPLMYWLTASSFAVFGTNEFAARLPSVLSALATIIITLLLGMRIVGFRAAWLGAFSLLLSGGFVLAGRFLILDPLLSLFTTLSLLSGYIGLREPKRRVFWWGVAGLACALGVLAKGPVALILCVPPLIASGWLHRDESRPRWLHYGIFLTSIVLLCIPWYAAIWASNPEFGSYFFWEHNFKRFTDGSNHHQPIWFYLPIIFGVMFPTSLLLPSLFAFLISRTERHRSIRTKDLGFLFCGSVWVLLFFSLSSCKLPTYILPAVPLISLMTGVMLNLTVCQPEFPSRIAQFLKRFPQRATLTCSLTGILVIVVDGWIGGVFSWVLAVATMGCFAIVVVTIWFWNQEIAFAPRSWAFTTLVGAALTCFVSAQFVPTISTTRSLYVKTDDLAEEHGESLIVFFGEKPHGAEIQLPADRIQYFPITRTHDFVAFMSEQKDAVLVTSDEVIESTRAAISSTHRLEPSAVHEHLYFARQNEGDVPKVVSLGNRGTR